MSLTCALGLAACLTFQGKRFPAEDAAAIEDQCHEMAEAGPRSFAAPPSPPPNTSIRDALNYEFRYYKGYVAAQSATDDGLQLDWSVAPQWRRVAWLRTCNAFDMAYHDDAKWTHLEKWPWK